VLELAAELNDLNLKIEGEISDNLDELRALTARVIKMSQANQRPDPDPEIAELLATVERHSTNPDFMSGFGFGVDFNRLVSEQEEGQ